MLEAIKSDIRTTGMIIVMFEDWLMNGSSPYKFVVETSKWRKIQNKMLLGDYGGSFTPSQIHNGIDKITEEVSFQSLSFSGEVSNLYDNVIGIPNSMKIVEALKKIAEVAEVAGTNVRVVNAQTI